MQKEKLIQAQRKLERILNEEIATTTEYREQLISEGLERYSIPRAKQISREEMRKMLEEDRVMAHLRRSSPYIAGIGEHQVVIDVGDGFVAKTHYKRIGKDSELLTIGRTPYNFTREAISSLSQLGIETPEVSFLRFYWQNGRLLLGSDVYHDSRKDDIASGLEEEETERDREIEKIMERYPNVCLTPDLRENKHYTVEEYGEGLVGSLKNGHYLKRQFQRVYDILNGLKTSYREHSEFVFEYEPHFVEGIKDGKRLNQEEQKDLAIRRMCLVQVPTNPNKEGRLVIGDINHVHVYRGLGGTND